MLTRRELGILTGLSLIGCEDKRETIEIRGSDSEVNLVQRLAEAFMSKRPDVAIAVTGGGSGTGITALLDETVDIANSSRPLAAQEKLLALRKGVKPTANLFATDALTIIVNASNPVEQLDVEDVARAFRGEASRWSDLGGGDTEVSCYGRQSSSGTYAFFRDVVVSGEYAGGVYEMNGNAQIVESVARDPGGIGYVAVGYLRSGAEGIKAVRIKAGSAEAVSPLDKRAVRAGKYPIARPLYQFTNGPPTGSLRDFILYELSAEGEVILEEMGFYPVVDAWRERNDHLGEHA